MSWGLGWKRPTDVFHLTLSYGPDADTLDDVTPTSSRSSSAASPFSGSSPTSQDAVISSNLDQLGFRIDLDWNAGDDEDQIALKLQSQVMVALPTPHDFVEVELTGRTENGGGANLGALVILPKLGVPYPFPKPDHEQVVVLGEWWKSDTENVINQALKSGLAPNVSDAHTINGHPGPVSACPSTRGFSLNVSRGKTYLLRLINAALNEELFFKIAGHKLTVVEVDATYIKPFKTDTVLIAPGQTTNVIVAADQGVGRYMVAASPFLDTPAVAVDNVTATATLHYSGTLANSQTTFTTPPARNATPIANNFIASLRSLNSKKYPAKVPQKIDHSLFFTVGLGINPCPSCKAGNGSRVVASVNNVTFVMPTIALLQAHVSNIKGVFTTDFPAKPPTPFNYTGSPPANLATTRGTKVYRLPYNSTVQVVLQDTGIIAPENHPVHLHGFNFFAVGRGLGNFNPKMDPKKFNLVDPVERNTIGVPSGGWVAIRFTADNPGVWFMHCHLEVHTTWGLKMAFLVDNGKGPNQSILPPPKDLPKC